MHILIVALHRPTKPTGVCRYAANLAQCLTVRDEISKISLVVGEWQYEYFKSVFSLVSSKIHIISIDIANRAVSRNFWYLFGLPTLVNRSKPDILHLGFPIPFLRFLLKCPIVATIHDVYPYEYPENFGYPRVLFNRFFLNLCVKYSHGLSCVSQSTLLSLKKYFPEIVDKETAVVYNYVDFSRIQLKQPNFIDNQQAFFLSVAQHRKNKNLDLLLHSFGLLIQRNTIDRSTKLLIVGSSGPETNFLKALVDQLGLQNQVLMISGINDSELSWLYQNCQLFIIPSSIEGFCIPLAEALHFSCKVVCSNIPIFQEVGSELCTYFDLQDNNIENLYQAMRTACQLSPDRSHLDQRFSPENTAATSLKLYSRLFNAND